MNNMNNSKRFAIIIILVTNAIIISFLESFIPVPIPVPGIKLGLGNIITMIAIVFLGFKDVLFIVLVRCFVVAILTRGILTLAFSLSGGILSAIAMWLIYKKLSRLFSIKGISIIGAIVHNTTQLTVAALILGQTIVMYYLPVLLVSAVVTGLITGSIADLAIKEVDKRGIFANLQQAKDGEEQSESHPKAEPLDVETETADSEAKTKDIEVKTDDLEA